MSLNGEVPVAVAQFASEPDSGANLAVVRELAERVAGTARVLVAPEYSMHLTRRAGPEMAPAAQPLDGPYVGGLAEVAAQSGCWVVAGMHERVPNDDRAYNTIVVIDDGGELRLTYRKIHLYDAFGHAESEWLVAGDPRQRVTFAVDGVTFGVQTCYDLRFPEMSRLLVDAGAQALIVPAAWVPGPLKEDHWLTLLRARAIENTCYVVASAQGAPGGAGNSVIVDPMGVPVAALGERRGVTTGSVSLERVEEVRLKNPSLKNRRYDVVHRA